MFGGGERKGAYEEVKAGAFDHDLSYDGQFPRRPRRWRV